MPNRIIREGILDSRRIDKLSPAAEVFYRRLMSVADDYGRFDGRPVKLVASCYPLRIRSIADEQVQKWVQECVDAELLYAYQVDGKPYIEIRDFGQRPRAASKYPGMDGSKTSVPKGKVYFLQAGPSGRIKIGYTEWQVESRVAALQTGSSEPLTILGVIEAGRSEEKSLHARFKASHVGGEWFEPTEELCAYIRTQCADICGHTADIKNAHGSAPNTNTNTHSNSLSLKEKEERTRADKTDGESRKSVSQQNGYGTGAAGDEAWDEFRSLGGRYGWQYSEFEWNEAREYNWKRLDFTQKLTAVAHLRSLIESGDTGLVRALPKNYLAKGMYMRAVGLPQPQAPKRLTLQDKLMARIIEAEKKEAAGAA